MLRENEQMPVPDQPTVFQIRIKGHLGHQWTDWFDGMVITLEEDGNTLLTGSVADQATLHGLIKKVRDLGMILVSVNSVLPDQMVLSFKTDDQDELRLGKGENDEHRHKNQ